MGLKLGMVNLVIACGPQRVTRSDIVLDDLKYLRKEIVERMMRVLGRSGLRVVSLSPCFRGGVWGVKYCWNRCSSILTFETSSQFFFRVAVQQMCVFKSLTGYTDYGGYENQNAHFLIIMKSKAMKSLFCSMIKMMDGLCLTPI